MNPVERSLASRKTRTDQPLRSQFATAYTTRRSRASQHTDCHAFCIKTLPLKTPLCSGGRYTPRKRLRITCGKARTCAAKQNRCYTTFFPSSSHNIVFCPLSGKPSAPHAPGFSPKRSLHIASSCLARKNSFFRPQPFACNPTAQFYI